MFIVKKRMEIAGSHSLVLPYESPCQRMHGHNWIVTVWVRGKKLNEYGLLADFAKIKQAIHGQLDHKHINDVVYFNPTAENMARWISDEISEKFGYTCFKVEVQESEGNLVIYEREEE